MRQNIHFLSKNQEKYSFPNLSLLVSLSSSHKTNCSQSKITRQ